MANNKTKIIFNSINPVEWDYFFHKCYDRITQGNSLTKEQYMLIETALFSEILMAFYRAYPEPGNEESFINLLLRPIDPAFRKQNDISKTIDLNCIVDIYKAHYKIFEQDIDIRESYYLIATLNDAQESYKATYLDGVFRTKLSKYTRFEKTGFEKAYKLLDQKLINNLENLKMENQTVQQNVLVISLLLLLRKRRLK